MEPRNDINAFLTSRRARITPEQVGLPSYGMRRVNGLRREEVALLAGLSTDYYAKIERGTIKAVSSQVFQGVVSALRLDDTEAAHLRDLMQSASTVVKPTRHRSERSTVPASIQRVLTAMVGVPAIVQNRRFDIVAANDLGRGLFAQVFEAPGKGNNARFLFFDNRSSDFLPDWESAANDVVAVLRASTAQDPLDTSLSNLIGELATRSGDFRIRWARHNVYAHTSGTKLFHHPVVGRLQLEFDAMTLPLNADLKLTVYSCTPEGPSADALQLLGAWVSTTTATAAAISN